jgi:hypothetical protein
VILDMTAVEAVIAWRRRCDDERPEHDRILAWDDVTDAWRAGPWREAVEPALALQSDGLARLRSSGHT